MDTSRHELVDSLYGSGTGRSLASIYLRRLHQLDAQCFVSAQRYNLRRLHRHTTSTLDSCRPRRLPDHTAPGPSPQVITAQHVELQRYASALEAPLTICETFSMAALLLAPFCGPWWDSRLKWRRLGLLLTVGLLSWATEYHVWNGHNEGYTCHRCDANPVISVFHHYAHGEYMGFSGAMCRACCGSLGRQCTAYNKRCGVRTVPTSAG